jgi:16S rRNA (guanine527-N7)-methyltransferase
MEIESSEWKKVIIEGANALDIQIDAKAAELFAIHAIELTKWGKKINLTAITDPFEIAVKHFLDSLIAVSFIPLDCTLLDIGSGGGFPGMPLKVVSPGLCVTLIDRSRKKVSFLRHVIRTLGLRQIKALQTGVEEWAGQDTTRNRYRVVICRAFSNLAGFIERALPVMAEGGKLIAFRGRIADGDIQSLLSFSLPYTIHRYQLPYLNTQRSLVIMG